MPDSVVFKLQPSPAGSSALKFPAFFATTRYAKICNHGLNHGCSDRVSVRPDLAMREQERTLFHVIDSFEQIPELGCACGCERNTQDMRGPQP